MKIRKTVEGFAGLLGIGTLALGMSGNAKGEQLYINFMNSGVNRSSLEIDHTAGATENYGYSDVTFLQAPTPALDIYSKVLFVPYKLANDARPPGSLSTIISEISGRGLSGPTSNNLGFFIEDALGENNFASKSIFADLYNSSHTLLGTYNVKDLASTGTTIPITVYNGLSYTMDVRFEDVPEPSSLALAGAGALAVGGFGIYNLMRRRKEE